MSFSFTIEKGTATLGAIQAKTQQAADKLNNDGFDAKSGFAAKAMLGKLEKYHSQGRGI